MPAIIERYTAPSPGRDGHEEPRASTVGADSLDRSSQTRWLSQGHHGARETQAARLRMRQSARYGIHCTVPYNPFYITV